MANASAGRRRPHRGGSALRGAPRRSGGASRTFQRRARDRALTRFVWADAGRRDRSAFASISAATYISERDFCGPERALAGPRAPRMRTLAVIPARLGSTRLPRKPLRLLAGLPLVARVWQRVTSLSLFDHVVVATDSTEIEAVARAHGADVVMTGEQNSGTERIAAVARRPKYSHYDVVVNVQGDEPFVSEQALAGATQRVTVGGFQIGTAAALATHAVLSDPNVVKVVTTTRGK